MRSGGSPRARAAVWSGAADELTTRAEHPCDFLEHPFEWLGDHECHRAGHRVERRRGERQGGRVARDERRRASRRRRPEFSRRDVQAHPCVAAIGQRPAATGEVEHGYLRVDRGLDPSVGVVARVVATLFEHTFRDARPFPVERLEVGAPCGTVGSMDGPEHCADAIGADGCFAADGQVKMAR